MEWSKHVFFFECHTFLHAMVLYQFLLQSEIMTLRLAFVDIAIFTSEKKKRNRSLIYN